MRDLLIAINEKYQRNKFTMWIVIIAIVFFILVTRGMDEMARSVGGSNTNTATSTGVSTGNTISQNAIDISKVEDDYSKVKEELGDVVKGKTDLVYLFVSLCNSQKPNAAYDMLSDGCKSALYPTLDDFKNNYYSVIFKTSKVAQITSFKNNTYQINYTEDEITTGKTSSSSIIDYITIDNEKINISKLVSGTQLDITSIAPYFTIYVEEKNVYMDCVELKIKVRNNTKADIYINDESNNQLMIVNEDNTAYLLDDVDMFDSTYLVCAGEEKEIKLRFNVSYSNDSKLKELKFNSIKIVNKDYYDSTSEVKNPTTGAIEYEKKKTNYSTTYNWSVKLA